MNDDGPPFRAQRTSYGRAVLVVSLTATSLRIGRLAEVVQSLLEQTLQPERILIWLSEEPFLFDRGVPRDQIPTNLRALADAADTPVEVRYTENTGPFRKIMPTIENFRGQLSSLIVVTADDDTCYPPRWLESLYAGYRRERCAVAFRARRILYEGGRPLPYRTWPKVDGYDELLRHTLMTTAKDGHLLTPDMLAKPFFSDDFKRLCPSRCDAWVGAALLARKTPTLKLSLVRIAKVGGHTLPPIPEFRAAEDAGVALAAHNRDLNDGFIAGTFRHYGLV